MSFNTLISLLLQASFFSLAAASEVITATGHGNAWKYGSGGGVIGFVVLILDIIVFSMCSSSPYLQLLSGNVLPHVTLRRTRFRG
jgi:hypothetical protein